MGDDVLLEVCVDSIASADAAYQAGADRIELNSALLLGGLSPSLGLLREVKSRVDIPVITMVRPRSGGFCYSASELTVLLRDSEILLENGADGIAAGVLNPDGSINLESWMEIRRLVESKSLVFHRAFDVIVDQMVGLEQLIDSGTDRVLTSGGAETAVQGVGMLRLLHKAAGDEIQIVVGSGVTPENVSELFKSTGCKQFHGTFSRIDTDRAGVVGGDQFRVTDPKLVQEARQILDSMRDA